MEHFSGHVPGERAYRRLVIGLFFAGVATFAQLYSPQAVLPLIAVEFEVAPATAALSVSLCTLGLALAVIPWSYAADRIGRLPAMTIGILVATTVGMIATFAPALELFLIARFVEGAALGAVPAIALAYLTEEVNPAYAGRAAGSYIAGTSVGGLAGRIIAGPVADVAAWRIGVLAVAALCIVSAVLFVRVAPLARGFVHGRGQTQGLLGKLLDGLRSPVQLALYAQAFLLMGGFVAIYNYLGFVLIAPPFSLPAWEMSLLFLAYLAGAVASPRVGALTARWGRLRVLLGSTAVMLAGVLLTLSSWLPLVLLGLLVLTAGFFSAHAIASGWAPASAPRRATAQASSLYYLAYYGGSSLLGWMLGFALIDLGWPGVAGSVGAMCVLAAGIAAFALRRAEDPTRSS